MDDSGGGANLGLIDRLYAASAKAFLTGNLDDAIDPSLVAEDVEWHDAAEQPDRQTYRGFDGVKRAMARFLEAWSDYRCEIEQIIPGRDDRIVVFTHELGRGRESGVAIDQRGAHVWTIRDGKVVEFRAYWDRERALAVAGIAGGEPQPADRNQRE